MMNKRNFLHATALAASLLDRKSTRLNSSHGYISYAVFCLKKKKKDNIRRWQGQRTTRRHDQTARNHYYERDLVSSIDASAEQLGVVTDGRQYSREDRVCVC